MINSKNILKIIVALSASIYFVWCCYSPYENGAFMHNINFPIHEVGHRVFIPFGEFITIAGGSLFQILVPIFFCLYFIYQKELFSSAITLFWVGNNFFDVSVYARDAVNMDLPLWSMSGNAETTIHDWNYLLARTNMLYHTNLVANIIYGIGVIITITAIVGSFYYASKEGDFGADAK